MFDSKDYYYNVIILISFSIPGPAFRRGAFFTFPMNVIYSCYGANEYPANPH